MARLPAPGLRQALDFMLELTALREPAALVRSVVERLPRLVASELTTLSICELDTGVRRVVSVPEGAIGEDDQATFNRLIHGHPLVRYHSAHRDGGACRISDLVATRDFRRREIYSEYYRRIRIDHVIAVPVIASPRLVMSYVLNRRGMDFRDGEKALLDRLRPALANLYRFAKMAERQPPGVPGAAALTPREREVLRWVAAGKSDRQIAEIAFASVRTIQKHLSNAYEKLGVENRTAAVMRMEALGSRWEPFAGGKGRSGT